MTEPSPVDPGVPGRFAAARSRLHLPLLCGLLATAYLFQVFNTALTLRDDGIQALGAWRLASGEMPYRDFFEIVPPLSLLPVAGLFKLFGPTVLAWRAVTVLLGILLLVCLDRLLQKGGADEAARCAALLFVGVFGVSFWPIPSHHWFVVLFQLAALLGLLHGLTSGTPLRWGFAAGAATASACFSLQDQGAYFTLALLPLFFPWVPEPRRRRALFFGWCAGGLAVAAPFLGWLLSRVPPADLWYQWVAFPLSQYSGIAGNRSELFGGWAAFETLWSGSGVGALLRGGSKAVALLVMFSLPFLAPGGLFAARWRKALPTPVLGLLAAGSAAAIGGALHRWALTNLVWAMPPLLAALLLSLPSKERRGRLARTVRYGTLGVLCVSALLQGAFLFSAARRSREVPIATPAGTTYALTALSAEEYRAVLGAVDRLVPVEAPLFCRGFLPMVNFLTLRKAPTRYNFFLYPGYHTQAQAREVVVALERRGDAFVLVQGDVLPGAPLEDYLLSRYERVWVGGSYMLLRPRPRAVSPSSGGGGEPLP